MGEIFGIVVTQVAILFVLIALGYVLCRKNVLTDDVRRGATTLLLDVVTPCVILTEMQQDRTQERMIGLAVAAGVFALYFAAAIAMSALLTLRGGSKAERATKRICMIYTNCGFMGLPLLASLTGVVGGDALFYGSVIIAINNLFIFTQGIALFGGKTGAKDKLRLLLTPAVISVFIGMALFFSGIRLPEIIARPVSYLGSMNTPLAMLVIGAIICRGRIADALRDKRVLLPVLTRNVMFPVLFFGAILLVQTLAGTLPYARQIMICLIIASCPVAGNCTIFSERYGGDDRLASGIFSLSTVLSAVTIPLVVAVMTSLLVPA